MSTGPKPRTNTEKMEIIDTLTKLLDKKIDPISEKLSKLEVIETSVEDALEEKKSSGY